MTEQPRRATARSAVYGGLSPEEWGAPAPSPQVADVVQYHSFAETGEGRLQRNDYLETLARMCIANASSRQHQTV